MPLTLSSTTKEKILVKLAPLDSTGAAATLDGDATFEVISGSATIEKVDALSAYIVSEDSAGVSTIKVSADADLGEGVETIDDTIAYSYNAPKATSLGLVADAPIAK